MKIVNTHIVKKEPNLVRFSDYCLGLFIQLPTLNSIKKAIKRGHLILNKEKAETGRWIHQGDLIELVNIDHQKPKSFNINIEIIYEDDYLAVINKPAGIPVGGNQFKTITNAIQGCLKKSKKEDRLPWPKPVHRLDAQTSGLLIIAKTSHALIKLGKMFEEKKIIKTYHALLKGTPPPDGTINSDVEGKRSSTTYKTISIVPSLKNKTISLVALKPQTGRTHQLRIHMSEIGYPILGDKLYTDNGTTIQHKGLFLCASQLKFQHPILGKEMNLTIDLPKKFNALMNREKRRYEKYPDLSK